MQRYNAAGGFDMLEREYSYYKSHEADLVSRDKGKCIALVGEEIVGVFDDELSAYSQMKEKYGLGNFLIQHRAPEYNNTQRYHSRVSFH